jgi:hypothetical protein
LAVEPASGPWVLEKHPGANAKSAVEVVPTSIATGTQLAAFRADPGERVLIATREGVIHLWSDRAWRQITPNVTAPAEKPGPGPALTK